MRESKFVPDINPETTLEEMEGRAKTLKKLAERKYGTFEKDIQEMIDKTFYEAVDVSIVKEKRKEIEGFTVKYEETLTWLENRYTVQRSSRKKGVGVNRQKLLSLRGKKRCSENNLQGSQ